ncbi:MAG TPA: ATP-binding protein [Streptosporangiaceae bacterium]|nr:ATP-binding protein [Streptosporangiaceae bacterium]
MEFWIEEQGTRWCEQAKDAPAGGSWTIARLLREGVLVAVREHLANGYEVRLVMSTAAATLAGLSAHAAESETFDEFRRMLNRGQFDELPNVASAWGADDETTWRYLQRMHVEHIPHEALGRLVHVTYERLIQGDPDAAIDALGGWLRRRLQKILTAPEIWAYLSDAGHPRRLLAGDPDTLAALQATVERQNRRAANARPRVGVVEQPHAAELSERLVLDADHQIVIVHGRAGSGKSHVAAAVVSQLVRKGWFAAAARMDAVSAGTCSARALGKDADLAESPVILLAGVAEGAPAVLLIDQLDAASTYSGRVPDAFDAVVELLDQAKLMPNLKVILVVRTVDLEQDPRLRNLQADTERVTSLAIGDLDPVAVRSALQAGGIDVAVLAEATLQLLRVPLHFSVFSRLSPGGQRIPYRTLPELYDQYTSEMRRRVERKVGHLEWPGITAALVDYMNRREMLLAPETVLDPFPRLEVNSLVSASVLVREGSRVGFFHETYFDYLFARAFVTVGHNLHDFLADSGQYLFRRAQARQVLEYLAATDRKEFRQTVVHLLTSDRIRPHLRDVVVGVLCQLDADPDDMRCLESLMFSGGSIETRLLPLLSIPAWFDAADQVAAGRPG